MLVCERWALVRLKQVSTVAFLPLYRTFGVTLVKTYIPGPLDYQDYDWLREKQFSNAHSVACPYHERAARLAGL